MNVETTGLEAAMLVRAVKDRATDIHIDPTLQGFQIRFRVDGHLRLWRELDSEEGVALVNQIKASVGIEPGTVFHPKGARFKTTVADQKLDVRVTLVPCISGPKLAIRLLDPARVITEVPRLGLHQDDLEKLQEWAESLNGMILVTGPTSSGKTTTVYTLLHELARESRHIVTIEDPVEYEIDGINQIQVDLRHELDFEEGVKTALRLDPDCVMVGEIRSPEAAEEAIIASIQGHVVIATMHSRDAVSVITRLRNFSLTNHQIATSVGVVVNQRLVRRLCLTCRAETEVDEVAARFFSTNGGRTPGKQFSAPGCDDCKGTGFFGRTGVFEIWNLDVTDYEMILSDEDEESIREHLRRNQRRFLLDDARGKIEEGVTSFGEIRGIGLDLPWTTR